MRKLKVSGSCDKHENLWMIAGVLGERQCLSTAPLALLHIVLNPGSIPRCRWFVDVCESLMQIYFFVLFFLWLYILKIAPYLLSLHWDSVTCVAAVASLWCRKLFDFCVLRPEENYSHDSRASPADGMTFISPNRDKLLKTMMRMCPAKRPRGCC